MEIQLVTKKRWPGRVRAALLFEDEVKIEGLIDTRFRGRFRETGLAVKQGVRLVFGGLGARADFETDRVRRVVARVLRRAGEMGATEVGLSVREDIRGGKEGFVAAAVEGALLGGYRFYRYRAPREDEPVPVERLFLLLESEREVQTLGAAVAEAIRRCAAVCYVRDLINEPSANKPPLLLARKAQELADGERVTVRVLEAEELERLGMGGILAVGRGSHHPPCLVHLTYTPRVKPRGVVVIVGKGITFDSGGLSLKTAQQMEQMKDDMSGAAAVFGVFHYLRNAELPILVHGLTPLAENMPGGGAQKPGDVIRHFNGKTTEVVNTDAEGRLLLADALAYGATLKPAALVDVATLTGACVVALGNEISGIMGNNQRLVDELIARGSEVGERFWQLPLFDPYRAHMRSEVADLKNIGKPQNAGTIIGGLFLREFVPPRVPWAHIDIAGTAWTSEGLDYCPVGATGVPVRTLIEFLRKVRF